MIEILPVLHGRLESARAVHEAFQALDPEVVAVELPSTLREPVLRAVARLPLASILRWSETDGRIAYLLVEPCDPIFEAIRLAVERGRRIELVDRDVEGYDAHDDPIPDSYAIARVGQAAFVAACEPAFAGRPPDEMDRLREATMAFHLARLDAGGARVLAVVGLAHTGRLRADWPDAGALPIGRAKRAGVELFNLHPDASREVLSEPAFVQAAFERWRVDETVELDRYAILRDLLRDARERHRREDGERLAHGRLGVALRFARNCALVRGGLAPDLFEIVTAARGVGGDDFAWHVWDLATAHAGQDAPTDLPVLRPSIEDLHRGARLLRFRRRLPGRRHLLRVVRPRAREMVPGEWRAQWRGALVCSYPPEDVRIEGYAAFLRKRAVGLLAAEQTRVEPFQASLRDGIDLRETIKNLAHDGRLFVREDRPVRGKVGALVIVFDEDESRYPFTLTWQGEHEEESDMAFFSTRPGEGARGFVGPGIARAEYGGFLMTYPPGRMFDVFEDPFFDVAETRAERLLLAGIDYGEDRLVVYAAAKAPRSRWTSYAARRGKKVVYLPIGQLSPVTLAALRVFHVLDGHPVRGWAKEFI